jgi:hypothetical protein
VSKDTDWAALYQEDPGDDSGDRSRPPIWVVGIVALSLVVGVWLLISQGSTGSDSVTGSTFSFSTSTFSSVSSDDVSEDTPLATSSEADSDIRTGLPDLDASVVVDGPGFGPGALAGDVVLTSLTLPPKLPPPASLWVLRPGGSVVKRVDVPMTPRTYPLLMTSGRIVFAHYGFGYVLDADLVDQAVRLVSTSLVVSGGKEGVVWFVGERSLTDEMTWVAPVDVAAQTVGERIIISDLFTEIVTGVADGLLVRPVDQDNNGLYAYWSPTEGLTPLDITDATQKTVMAASGNYAAVVSKDEVSILNVANGEYVSTFSLQFGDVDVSSVCLSPDQEYVAVVASNGLAIVGNTSNGRTIDLTQAANSRRPAIRSVAWTSADQLVYVIELRDETAVETFDVTTRGRHQIATLQGSHEWWLTASGTMC